MAQDYKLQPGRRIRLMSGAEIIVEKELGEGGQGVVYKVDWNGTEMALKWYKPNGMGKDPQAFRSNLENIIQKGSPSDAFLWPIALTEWESGVFGYIMELRDPDCHEVGEFMLTRVKFASFKTTVDAALAITEAYRKLHIMGYSYQDLNDGNFFIDPKTGKVQICDNENVAPNGTNMGIRGKPRYMAPEVVTGRNMPNTASDTFSMSVILFILFTLTHPLEGKRSLAPVMTEELQKKLYGSEPLFILDPKNRANAPDPKVHCNIGMMWGFLPQYMKDLFQKAFSQEALLDPNRRPLERDWINKLVRFRSEIIKCPHGKCPNEIFTDQGRSTVCEVCRGPIRIPTRLVFPSYAIPALPGTRIYRTQLGVCNVNETTMPVGVIQQDKDDPRRLYLKNKSDKIWNAVTPSGKAKQVAPEERIPMMPGISFTVYDTEIKIEGETK